MVGSSPAGCTTFYPQIPRPEYMRDAFRNDLAPLKQHLHKIMKELLNNPRIIYLKGNHEDMFVKAAREIKSLNLFAKDITREKVRNGLWEAFYFGRNVDNITLALGNGGISTLIDWVIDIWIPCRMAKIKFSNATS